ncbi:MAG: adenosine deaminase [Myxococcales bacterium]|nr:adenosine deaminase [Myxococcales bacterium]
MAKEYSDLHRHLDGSLRLSTLRDLADDAGVALPQDESEIHFFAGMGLDQALARFGITLSVLQTPDAVRRVAAEICEDAASEGVSTLEIRFAPQLHQGAAPEEIVDAALDGVGGRAGVILCGLYGEPPTVLERLVTIGHAREGVCGIDLAGGPGPGHSFGMEDYKQAYRLARDSGLGRTVHAGEGRPPAEIRFAIEHLHAQRIGHGTSLLDDPAVLDLVLERGVLIEACPTSNVHTGIIGAVTEHPLATWLRLGVLVTVCTDNTLLSQVDAPTEYGRVSAIEGITERELEVLVANGRSAAFF